MLKKNGLLLLLLLNFATHTYSEIKNNGTPFIITYEKNQYNSGTQNWDITQTQNGLMYFANNAGVLEFDGNNWRLFPVPNNSIVRSLAVDSLSRVYVGAFNEFGYLEPNEIGNLSYHSLLHLLPEEDRNFEDVWQIFPYNKGILFHTFHKIFYYKSGNISQIKTDSEFHLSFMVNNQFFVRKKHHGLLKLNGATLDLVSGGEFFSDIEIVGILPYSEDKLLIATALKGIYLFDGNRILPWKTEINSVLQSKQIFSTEALDNNSFAFGTVRDGVYIIEQDGNLIQHISTKNGLQNNTVLSIFSDMDQNLWVGLDNGIDYIEINSPLSIFPGRKDLGTGYASIYYNGYLYLGTNMGLFAKVHDFSNTINNNDEFELVQNTAGQVWTLQVIAGELICGHNKGTFRINRKRGELISDVEGGWKYLFKEEFPNIMIGGTYTGLVLFKKSPQSNMEWKFEKRIDGFNESSREMIWDEDNSIWMCHGYKGVYRLFLNENFDRCDKYRFFGKEDGFGSNLNISIHKIRGEKVFSTDDGFYKYVPEIDQFKAHKYLNNLFETKERVNKLFEEKNGDIWFFQGGSAGFLKFQIDNTYEIIKKPFLPLKGTIINAFENILIIDKENVLLGTERGFVHYDPSIIKRHNLPFKVFIRKVTVTKPNDSIIFLGSSVNKSYQADISEPVKTQLSYKNNAIRFQFSTPQYSSPNFTQYQCQLVGLDLFPSKWGENLQKEYTNLNEGEYVFRVVARNQYGVNSTCDEFHFTILPPWYRSNIAFIVYSVISILFIYVIIYSIKRRMRKIQQLLKKKQEEELKSKEQKYREEALIAEREIIQLKNDKLRNDVDFKNRELASSTMNIIHKNEVLTYAVGELRNALKKIKDPTALVQVRRLMKRIDSEFNSEHDWEQFAVHFDQVHEDFLKRLRKSYPQLTPKDLKLCAYLRMNLSTKEIAPLMNISIRGVEISRYRLRKKFSLTRDENLIDFILKV